MAVSSEPWKSQVSLANSNLPPLRVHHLLLWMAFTGDFSWLYEASLVGWEIVTAIVVGAAVAVTLLGISWRTRGLAYFNQPGQWLLLVIAATGLARFGREALYRVWLNESDFDARP